jgi:hypothetical protein
MPGPPPGMFRFKAFNYFAFSSIFYCTYTDSNLMGKIFLIGFLLAFSLQSACAQKFLLFQKNRHRQALYKVGDVLSFTIKGNTTKFTGEIRGFEDSVIVFRFYRINPKEISHLYVDDKTRIWYIFRYKYGKVLPIAGAGYCMLELVNTGELTRETLIIGGSLIGAGFLLKTIIGERIRIKGKRKLVIGGNEPNAREER